MKFKHVIVDIAINLWYSWNFVRMEDIKRICNQIVRVSKYTSNKKIYEEFEGFLFKLVWREQFSTNLYLTQFFVIFILFNNYQLIMINPIIGIHYEFS